MSKNIFDSQSILEWARKQPKDKVYDFLNMNTCIQGQYYKHLGLEPIYVIKNVDIYHAARMTPHTFGDFCDRLEVSMVGGRWT